MLRGRWLVFAAFATVVLPTFCRAALPGLPEGTAYDPAIPTPSSALGFEVGEWHARHDQIVAYLSELAAASDRVELREQGRTHEGRRQILLVISSPANLDRLEEIRLRHRAIARGEAAEDGSERPAIAALLYSIHGNEASGSNASLVVAYHLAASRDPEVAALLDDVVVLLDPSQNPDGLGRFATWANMHRSRVANPDPRHREHVESWPNGRTNHYWFDLNRDWLPLVHPESRNRVATFHAFRPTVLADFHEMGSDATYFFQPGVPSRQNPLTDPRSLELTRLIARRHAATLDAAGELYYSEEGFDDYYYGKGSTYPDAQGSIGILFEQASARGHLRDTDNGPLAFRDAIANQVRTSLSTVAATAEHRRELLAYQAAAPREALALAAEDPRLAFVCDDGGDRAARRDLLAILAAHQVEVRRLARPVEVDGHGFAPASAFAVPLEQPQYRLVQGLLAPFHEFPDEEFYDVSTWTLPLAFDLHCAELPRRASARGDALLGELPAEDDATPWPTGAVTVAYAFEWRSSDAPRALARLHAAGAHPRVATRAFTGATDRGPRAFGPGTILIPTGGRIPPPAELPSIVAGAVAGTGVEVFALASGLTADGIDLGSPSAPALEAPRTALLVGGRVSTYEAGEMWELLDRRLELPVTLLEAGALGRLGRHGTTHLLLVDGDYRELSEESANTVARWVKGGGIAVGSKRGALWLDQALQPIEDDTTGESSGATGPADQATYGDFDADRAKALLAGAIFEARIDRTHPLGFGYPDDRLPLFRNHTRLLSASANPYENVAVYTEEPRLSGYAAPATMERIAGTAAVVARRHGEGLVVLIADDPSFRGFFRGSQRLVANALFFGSAVRETTAPELWHEGMPPGDEDP